MQVICPKCETEMETGRVWETVTCPGCGLKGYWDEIYDRETMDCRPSFGWDKVDEN